MKNSRKKQKITNVKLVDLAKSFWKNGERKRNCPKCGSAIEYKDKWSYIYAYQDNRRCKPCVCKDTAIEHDYKIKFLGKNNPFYGKKHTDKTKKLLSNQDKTHCLGENNPMKRPEMRAYFSKLLTGSGNPMYGKVVSSETRKKLSVHSKGKNNPMYGKPTPSGAGNGWANWYKGHHFRSLRELQFFITEVEGKGMSCESAQKYRIPYKSYDGTERTYQPDFLVGNSLIEVKPKKLWDTPLVKLKKEVGEKFCIENGLEYKLIDIEPNSSILKDKYLNGEIRFVEKYKDKFEKYAGIK